MRQDERHHPSDDIFVGIDLATRQHQVVVVDAQGQRLTSFKVPHSREGLHELVERCTSRRVCRDRGRVRFAFEATGHVWEAVGAFFEQQGLRYQVVNPLATFRVREARQMGRDTRDLTDAEEIAQLLRTGVVTQCQLLPAQYMQLRRAWGEYHRLRCERLRDLSHADGSHTGERARARGPRVCQPAAGRRCRDARGAACGRRGVMHGVPPDQRSAAGHPGELRGRLRARTPPAADGSRSILGPFDVDDGHTALMRSATGAQPTEAAHIRQSEMCATCHTLITQAFDADGNVVGSLPEQVPYQEWQHSAFVSEEVGCQSCHMPAVAEPMRISSVLGEEREGLGRHTFVGGNFFMLRMLNRYRDDLGVEALPVELNAAAAATVRQLERDTATLMIERAEWAEGALEIVVAVENRTGHKLPTGYPSRRGWLHLTVRDTQDRIVFESGRVASSGAITGNDNDEDPTRFEPHHEEIRGADQVQIYEAIMAGPDGTVTTGLLTATQYMKDNRLLPRGFDKTTAGDDIAVRGVARGDGDFGAARDHVRYVVGPGASDGPYRIKVELRYQPIGFRWAWNLNDYEATEPRRFVRYYDAMSANSSVVLAAAAATIE